MSYTHMDAMQHKLIQEAVKAGVEVGFDISTLMYRMKDGEWGLFEVSYEFVEDVCKMLGPEVGWLFLRHGTTVDGIRLMTSIATMHQWQHPRET